MGDSLGMLLTLEKEVHWFVNDVWRGCVRVEDYPLDTPMWGVVDVYGRCKQVKAEICTGKLLLPSLHVLIIAPQKINWKWSTLIWELLTVVGS